MPHHTESRRRKTPVPPEDVREMTLIHEATGERDLDERQVGLEKETGCPCDARPPQMLTGASPEEAREAPSQVGGMHSDVLCDRPNGQGLGAPVGEELLCLREPSRDRAAAIPRGRRGGRIDQLQAQPLRQNRRIVVPRSGLSSDRARESEGLVALDRRRDDGKRDRIGDG